MGGLLPADVAAAAPASSDSAVRVLSSLTPALPPMPAPAEVTAAASSPRADAEQAAAPTSASPAASLADIRVTPAMAEQWGAITTAGMLAGTLYGGVREAATSPAPTLPPAASLRQHQAAVRAAMEAHLLRIARASVAGGARLGATCGVFGAAQLALAAVGGAGGPGEGAVPHAWWATTGAGAVTAALLGLAAGPPSFALRLHSALSYSLLGAGLALPLGLLQDGLRALLPPAEGSTATAAAAAGGGAAAGAAGHPSSAGSSSGVVGEAIGRLERRVEGAFRGARGAEGRQGSEGGRDAGRGQ